MLADMAGDGIPTYLWAQVTLPAQSVIEYGRARLMRDDGPLTWRHAHVAEVTAEVTDVVAGMVLGYPLPADIRPQEDYSAPEIVRPMIWLEGHAPASWYVNMLAVFAEYRGQGIGRRLLERAESVAGAAGAASLSIIVAEANAGAFALYRRFGFRERARRAIVGFPGFAFRGDWVLMVK